MPRSQLFFSLILVATLLPFHVGHAQSAEEPAFLVVAPDRGFLGNEETRDVFEQFRRHVPRATLAFTTVEKTKENMKEALAGLDAGRVVVLPFFLSKHHALYRRARVALESIDDYDVRFATPFGESYLAEEILFDRVADLSKQPAQEALVVVAYGADTQAAAESIRGDFRPMVERVAAKYGLAESTVVVQYGRAAPEEAARAAFGVGVGRIEALAAEYERVLVVPFNLGMRYTTMMASWHWFHRSLHGVDGISASGEGVLPHSNVLRWMRKAANRHRSLARADVGVIVVPHGSNYNWNETMRAGIAPLTDRYNIEEAFSMVDPVVIERAVRKLEEEGMKAAVVMRIFALASSFREKAEYVLGLQPTYSGGMGGRFPERVESHLLFYTLGGLEAHPLFAKALLDRARAVSIDPARETIILLAHGTGSDEANAHWMQNLAALAETMRAQGGEAFRAIKYYTWREDWPEKREEAVQVIREMVREAATGDGIALVVPARTSGRGHAEEYLDGLDYRYATGFAPHPLFSEWLRAQIEEGMAHFVGVEASGRSTRRAVTGSPQEQR